jgi:hypothetical protein
MNGFDGGNEEGAITAGYLTMGPFAEVVATPGNMVEFYLAQLR